MWHSGNALIPTRVGLSPLFRVELWAELPHVYVWPSGEVRLLCTALYFGLIGGILVYGLLVCNGHVVRRDPDVSEEHTGCMFRVG
jgi:hypothetical protein